MGETAAIGIDIGGTKLVAARVGWDGERGEGVRVTTPTGDAEELLRSVEAIVAELDADAVLPVGVGVAGLVSPAGVLRYGPNIGVSDLPLEQRLSELLDVPVAVANDATAALWGEVRAGAASDHAEVVMLTLGTGVGGGVVAGGRLVEGVGAYAGELGHVIVSEGGRPCPCGNFGCLEAYASGTAVELRARARLVDRSIDTTLRTVGERDLTGEDVAEAALDGDPFAREILEEAGRWLGVGIATLANILDPAIVVVGGGASIRSARFMLPSARAALRERLLGVGHRSPPDVVDAALGDDAGIVGAALLAADRAA